MATLDTKTFKKTLAEQFGKQALLINRAFQGQQEYLDKKLAQITAEIKKLDKRILALEGRMQKVEHSMTALSSKVTNYLQLSDKRYLELKRRDLILAQWLKQLADKSGLPIDLTELERI